MKKDRWWLFFIPLLHQISTVCLLCWCMNVHCCNEPVLPLLYVPVCCYVLPFFHFFLTNRQYSPPPPPPFLPLLPPPHIARLSLFLHVLYYVLEYLIFTYTSEEIKDISIFQSSFHRHGWAMLSPSSLSSFLHLLSPFPPTSCDWYVCKVICILKACFYFFPLPIAIHFPSPFFLPFLLLSFSPLFTPLPVSVPASLSLPLSLCLCLHLISRSYRRTKELNAFGPISAFGTAVNEAGISVIRITQGFKTSIMSHNHCFSRLMVITPTIGAGQTTENHTTCIHDMTTGGEYKKRWEMSKKEGQKEKQASTGTIYTHTCGCCLTITGHTWMLRTWPIRGNILLLDTQASQMVGSWTMITAQLCERKGRRERKLSVCMWWRDD